MRDLKPPNFMRLADGTLLQREADGSYRPTTSLTDRTRLDALTDDEIERMGADDPDHPALDDAFWAGVDGASAAGLRSVRLDEDIVAYFRREGDGYQTRINEVLRRYVDEQQKARC